MNRHALEASRRLFLLFVAVVGASVLAGGAQQGDANGKKTQQAPLDYVKNEVNIEVDGVRVQAKGLSEPECEQIAKLTHSLGQWMVEESGFPIFGGGVNVRLRANPGECPNAYVGGSNAITYVVPDAAAFRDGRNGDAPSDWIAMLALEMGWSRVLKPMWCMPQAVRYAIDRVLLNRYGPRLVEEFGENWWMGGKPTEGTLYGLPLDHPLVVQSDRATAILQRTLDEVGIETFLLRLKNWNDRRLSGAASFEDLQDFVLVNLAPDGRAPDEPIPEELLLLAPVALAMNGPWDEERGSRITGFQHDLSRSSAVSLRLWFGEKDRVPPEFVSVRQGNPTLFLRRPGQGRWMLNSLEAVLRTTGGFVDEQFHVVVMDTEGRELMRWSYPISALPSVEEGVDWLRLGNTAYPQLERGYLIGLEFPTMKEGQDVEIGVWPGRETDHAFWAHAGSSVRAIEEPIDFAIVVELRATEVNRQKLPREILKMDK